LFRWFDGARADFKVDLVFLDPPYRFVTERPADVRRLAARIAERHLSPAGTVVFRHDARDLLDLPPLAPADRREYGGMVLEFLRRVDSMPA
jgi:16S rRNA G966 N2-methylase RsmD